MAELKFGKDGTLYCNTVRYNWKQVRNLVADGTNSKLGGTGAWNLELTNINVSITTGTFYFNTGFAMMRQSMPAPKAGHKYYGALLWSLATGATTGDNRFEWYSGDGANQLMVFANKTAVGGRYVLLSSIQSLSTVVTGSAGSWMIRNFCTSLSSGGTCKNIMIVDLTDAFGAGNEPTKEWCDQNIIEHNVINNNGDQLNPALSTSNYQPYTPDGIDVDPRNFGAHDYDVYPRDPIWLCYTYPEYAEGFLKMPTSYYVNKNTLEYFQVYANGDFTYNNAASLNVYHPIAEPPLGAAYTVDGSNFCGGGGMSSWKKYSGLSSRSSFSTGNYPFRIDIDNRYIEGEMWLTNFFLTTADSQVTWYNYNHKLSGTSDITVSAINKEWCERWIGGPLNSIIHIKDHQNTQIKIIGRDNAYERIGYIESNGTQYINTGVVANGSTTLTVKFKPSDTYVNDRMVSGFYAGVTSSITYYAYRYTGESANYNFEYGNTINAPITFAYNLGVHNFTAKGNKVTWDYNNVTLSGSPTWHNLPYYICGRNNNGKADCLGSYKIYGVVIKNSSGTTVRNMVPVKRISDGAIGLLDTINNVFYGNSGSGTFKYGYTSEKQALYDIICNDIIIRPEQNKIIFDKTGTITCKKLVKSTNY